jgi:hypothetical protein
MTEKPEDKADKSPRPSQSRALALLPAAAKDEAAAGASQTKPEQTKVASGFAAAARRWTDDARKRLGAVTPAVTQAWPTAAAVLCAIGLGWAGGALHAADPEPAISAKTAELDARLGQMAEELRAIREMTGASIRAARAPSEEMKPLNDRLGQISGTLDRVEKNDRDLSIRLTQLGEKFDRFEKSAGPLTTASIPAPSKPSADPHALPKPDPKLVTPPTTEAAKEALPRVEGWSLRDMSNGVALLENRRGALIEVEPGDMLRELGRVKRFERRGPRWVVVTEKGAIVE